MFRADLHVHALMDEALFFFRGRPGRGGLARDPDDILRNQVAIADWRRCGFGIAVVALYSPPVLHRGRGHLREIQRQAAAVHELARAHPTAVEVALDPDAARRIAGSGRTALLLAVEGAHGIADEDDVAALHGAGVRLLTLAHLRDNAVAAAAAARHPLDGPNWWFMQRRRTHGTWHNERGLSALGGRVVRRLQELGMLIDLAHASDRAFGEVLSLTASDSTPLLVTHTGSRALAPGERNLSDEGAGAIAARGGMIGISLWRRLLRVAPAGRPEGFAPGTTDDYILHYRHLARAAGAGAIALGSDLNGMIWRPRGTAACPCGVRHLGDWPELERALVAAGLPEPALATTGERLLAAWSGARALARSRAVKRG